MKLGGRTVLCVAIILPAMRVGYFPEPKTLLSFVGVITLTVIWTYLMDALYWLLKELWSARGGIYRSIRD